MFKKISLKIMFILSFPFFTFGEKINTPLAGDITSLEYVFKKILGAILDLAVPIIVLGIMYTGFLFIKAQGNDSELSKAKEALVYVLIGTAIVIASNALYGILYATHNAM